MHLRLLPHLFVMVSLTTPSAHAVPDDYKVNVREGCRQLISGAYIRVYDEREKNRTLAKSLAGQLADTETALKAAQKELASAKAAAAAGTFELARANAADRASAKVRTMEAQRAEYQALLLQAEAAAASAARDERELLHAVAPIFEITRANDKADGGYPLRLDYKATCPKYRALCPLPVADADKLAAVKVEGAAPEACKRYVSQSRMR